jgi:hypothetical protein
VNLSPGLAMPVVLAAAFSGGFLVNEWSHGSLAETTGLGHHHMLDHGGHHCAAHDDAERAAYHVAHMHGSEPVAHAACTGGPAMHGVGTLPAPARPGGHHG